jgi:hypothetical protein
LAWVCKVYISDFLRFIPGVPDVGFVALHELFTMVLANRETSRHPGLIRSQEAFSYTDYATGWIGRRNNQLLTIVELNDAAPRTKTSWFPLKRFRA